MIPIEGGAHDEGKALKEREEQPGYSRLLALTMRLRIADHGVEAAKALFDVGNDRAAVMPLYQPHLTTLTRNKVPEPRLWSCLLRRRMLICGALEGRACRPEGKLRRTKACVKLKRGPSGAAFSMETFR
jgi:uncharacterized membrane-anchored protein